jgi:lactobin A/cerein 7B family class IIb bacteriocin
MTYDSHAFSAMSESELSEINGGVAPLVVVLIVVGCAAIFGLGVYNGYKDTKDQKK